MDRGPLKSLDSIAYGFVPVQVPKRTWNVAETIKSACSKRRKILWGNVKVTGKFNHSYVFYSPAVFKNGTSRVRNLFIRSVCSYPVNLLDDTWYVCILFQKKKKKKSDSHMINWKLGYGVGVKYILIYSWTGGCPPLLSVGRTLVPYPDSFCNAWPGSIYV